MTRDRGVVATIRPRALVLGLEHRPAVAVVRSLGRRGVPMVGVERDPGARGRVSRYLQQVVMVGPSEESTLSTLEAHAGDAAARLYASDSRFVHPYELGANVYC